MNTLSGRYTEPRPFFVRSQHEQEYVYDEWAYECCIQKRLLPEPVVMVTEPIGLTWFPGTNHNYRLGEFFTLQNHAGEYLSNPYTASHFHKGTLTTSLYCAWVVYAISDLRLLYAKLDALKCILRERTPCLPCLGTFERTDCGIVCRTLKAVSKADIKAIEQRDAGQAEKKKGICDWTQRTKEVRPCYDILNKLSRVITRTMV